MNILYELPIKLYAMDFLILYHMLEFLALFKFEAFADDKFILAERVKFLFERVENIVEKGENAIPPFPTMFLKGFS